VAARHLVVLRISSFGETGPSRVISEVRPLATPREYSDSVDSIGMFKADMRSRSNDRREKGLR